MANLPLILLIIASLSTGGVVISIIVALRALRERRVTIFPMVKEAESIRAKRAFLAIAFFILLSALSIGGWIATQRAPKNILQANIDATEQTHRETAAAFNVAPEATAQISDTPTTIAPPPTANIIGSSQVLTPTPKPTATEPPPTPSPQTTAPTATTPAETTPVPIPENLSMGPISFALEVTDRRKAINPAESFSGSPDVIYAVYPYSGMKNGLPFTSIWYYQNREIVRNDVEWTWGTTDSAYVIITPIGTGTYRVELKIADTLVVSSSFELTP